MAKLELPVRSFIESVARRAFPERDFSRGSGINDLVIKAFSVLMQPLRHEIDVVKVNQALTNYLYMRPRDLDALAANWGKFRQTGSRVEGLVRLYFNEATDFNLAFLEFVDDAGSIYNLTAPVTIVAADLLANRRPDGSFSYDVRVRSNGIGDRYVVPAGAIRTVRGGPVSLFACENVADFQVSSPNESNYDVVNAMYRNIGLRNLVSRASIRAPLLDQFSNILDLFIAGADHPKMYRDIVRVDIDSQPVDLHLGGTVDVWCNTNAVSLRQVTVAYLPSSRRIRIVSDEQAAAGELAYTFSRGLLTPEGMFLSPDDVQTTLDESFSVVFDVDGIPSSTLVTAVADNDRWPLAARDLTGGTNLVAMPNRGHAAGTQSIYVIDPVGPNLNRTPVGVGDMISTSAHGRRRITAKSGRVLELSPVELPNEVAAYLPQAAVSAGEREVSASLIDATVRPNDRVRIDTGPAAGMYTALAKDTDTVYLGRPVASGIVEQTAVLGGGQYEWTYRGEVTAAASTLFSGVTVDEVVLNVSATEIYFQTGFNISPTGFDVQVGDEIAVAGIIGVSGTYVVAAVNTSGPRHFVTVTAATVSVPPPTGGTATVVRPVQYAGAELPPFVDTTFWVYTGAGAGHDQTATLWARITEVRRAVDSVVFVVTGAPIVGLAPCTIIGGLAGDLRVSDQLLIERDRPSSFEPDSILDDSVNPTIYCNVLDTDLVSSAVTVSAIGIGEQTEPGDLITFTGIPGIDAADLPKTGGDGTKVTAFVSAVVTADQVQIATPFPFTIPANTSYTVVKNRTPAVVMSAVTAVVPATKTVQFATFERGVGDGIGMALAVEKPTVSGLLISAIAVTPTHANIQFSGAPSLSNLFLSDKLVITGDPLYNGTYRIMSVDATSFSVVVEAVFPSSFGGPGTIAARIDRTSINPIVASTAGLVRTLRFSPPQLVFKIEMSAELYAAPNAADIGRTVEQVIGNTTFRGTLYSYNNATRIWEIVPNVLTGDLFSDTVTAFGSIGGFAAAVPLGTESRIEFPSGTDLTAFVRGDRMVISGGTAIDGVYFLNTVRPDASNPYVIVSGNVAPVAGPGPHGTCSLTRPYYVNILGSSAKAFPVTAGIDRNAGAGYPRGYVAPTAPADIGKIVRQGAYTGILDEVDATPESYTWKVRPIGDSDLFDRLDVPTFVANSATSPQPTDPQGTLLEPASQAAVDLASVSFVLANTPVEVVTDMPRLLPRFSRNGALLDGSTLRVFGPALPAAPDFIAAGVTAGMQVMLLAGDNLGTFEITAVAADSLTLAVEPAAEPVRIANAPAPQRLTIPPGGLNLSTGLPIVEPGSGIGVWGGPGRVLRIEGGGRTYNIPIGATPTDDSIVPLYPVAATLLPTTRWTWEIVEAFHTDFWIIDPADSEGYRIYRPPLEIGTTLLSRSSGSVSASGSTFRDNGADFSSIIGAGDYASGDYLLYIDSGEAANVDPIVINGLVSATQIDVSPVVFSTSEPDIQYRIVYRPRITDKEGWYRGVVVNADTIRLQVPAASDLSRYGTLHHVVIMVEPSPIGAATPTWESPRLTGTFNSVTGELTVETAAGTAQSSGSDIWVDGSGFNPDRFYDTVRVHLRTIDRNVVKSGAGSVIDTYNYYANREFFALPVVRVQAVELLDPETLAPVRQLPYTFVIGDKGLRYSTVETNSIEINDADADFQPIRISYIADSSIKDINAYLNNPDTRVLGQSVMAKRMETITVDISMRVRSERSSTSIAVAVSSYINALRSSRRLTKAEIIKYLFQENLISYVELDTVRMAATYLPIDDSPSVASDVNEIFGSDVACYLSGRINITKITVGT